MANISFTATANVAIAGITPAAGPKPTVTVSSSFNSGATPADDYFSDTFVINAGTTATAINLGKINAGLFMMISTSGPIRVIISQDLGAGPVDIETAVDSFYAIETGFLGLKLANPGGTAQQVSISIAGNRPAVGGGAGIF
jgi:hypothetical protein